MPVRRMVIGVGIGGTFEKCALMAKEALTRRDRETFRDSLCAGDGRRTSGENQPAGNRTGRSRGTTTALAVHINTYPTHIAGLPVAVNICCHVNRHVIRVI